MLLLEEEEERRRKCIVARIKEKRKGRRNGFVVKVARDVIE